MAQGGNKGRKRKVRSPDTWKMQLMTRWLRRTEKNVKFLNRSTEHMRSEQCQCHFGLKLAILFELFSLPMFECVRARDCLRVDDERVLPVHVWIPLAVQTCERSATPLCVSVSPSASVGSGLAVYFCQCRIDGVLQTLHSSPGCFSLFLLSPLAVYLLLCAPLPPSASPSLLLLMLAWLLNISSSLPPPHCTPLHHRTGLKSLFRSDNELFVYVGVCELFLMVDPCSWLHILASFCVVLNANCSSSLWLFKADFDNQWIVLSKM